MPRGPVSQSLADGPEEHRLKAEAARNDVADRIDFISWLPQQAALFELYDSHDLFLFPSLHDSGGFVVLEALSRACLSSASISEAQRTL